MGLIQIFQNIFNSTKIKTKQSSIVSINGKVYKGDSIIVKNKKVIVDGKEIENFDPVEVNINITGDCGDIENTSGDITVSGNVNGKINTVSGNITCQNVKGDIETVSGNVKCGDVTGDIETLSGDVK